MIGTAEDGSKFSATHDNYGSKGAISRQQFTSNALSAFIRNDITLTTFRVDAID